MLILEDKERENKYLLNIYLDKKKNQKTIINSEAEKGPQLKWHRGQ